MESASATDDIPRAIRAVASIEAVPTILEVLCRTTGMGFAVVARVTEERWVACSVRDGIDFGLVPGGELAVTTTLCREVRRSQETIAIDNVSKDAVYCGHPTPAMYGFQSYVSTPIVLKDGSFFGTLCAIDRRPAVVTTPETLGMFKLFAELIGVHLDAIDRLRSSEASLADERRTAELREQFNAVMGHDLRNPLGAIVGSADLLLQTPMSEAAAQLVGRIKRSGRRMSAHIDDVLDFARGRLGSGLTLRVDDDEPLDVILQQVIAELRVSSGRTIETDVALDAPVRCDRSRLGQLFSNLLANAVSHGAADEPIRVRASTAGGVFRFAVTNGGEPIAASALEQLFHPFFRGSVRPSEQGLGLGLYIASEIARAHGGTLDVASTSEGTTFTFEMPLR